ncbi:hypothetical protein AB4059_00590 [Lysobacter sp. 2RAF19]
MKNIRIGVLVFASRALLLGAILASTGCASVNGFSWTYEPSSFADRMGMHGCAISVPLTSDQVIEGAKLMGNPSPETHGAWINMKAEFREGDQLRFVNCSEVKGTTGTDFYALVRNNVVILKFAPMLY